MADQEQVERLKRDVCEWNEWREEHPDIWPDLRRQAWAADIRRMRHIGDFTNWQEDGSVSRGV